MVNLSVKHIRHFRTSDLFCAVGFAALAAGCAACATSHPKDVPPEQAAKIDRKLVRDAVLYDPGTERGAIVPEISAPRLHAIFVPEHIENNRLIEAHREWQLEGDVTILGIPTVSTDTKSKRKAESNNDSQN